MSYGGIQSIASQPVQPTELVAAIATFAALKPDALAVCTSDSALTYSQLWVAARALATDLISQDVRPGQPVVVSVAPSERMIVALLGVMAAGGAYVPIDSREDAVHPATHITLAGIQHAVVDTAGSTEFIEQIVNTNGQDTSNEATKLPPISKDHLAYVMFTSGTTRRPRAVGVTHGQLAFSTQARHLIYGPPNRFLLLSPAFFDSSVAGIWGTLTAGGTLVVASDDQRRDPGEIVSLIDSHQVTRTLMIPSLYQEILLSIEVGDRRRLESLREVILAGEKLQDALIRRHFTLLPNVEIVNEYGPTESTVWSTYRRYREPAPSTIGSAIPGANLAVVDSELIPVQEGSPGELLIGGPGVTNGYLDDPEATRRSFITADHLGPGTWYRTGDLARRTSSGEFEYLGRVDRQVKIRGRRIELEVVEQALSEIPGVAAVAAHASTDRSHIVAHIVLTTTASGEHELEQARQLRPDWIRPDEIYVHTNLPVTANGKINFRALQAHANDTHKYQESSDTSSNPNTDSVEALVAQVWQKILKRQDVPHNANFFDLGGNSLLIMRLQRELVASTGQEIAVISLFQHTTISAQSTMLSSAVQPPQNASPANRADRARLARARRRGFGKG